MESNRDVIPEKQPVSFLLSGDGVSLGTLVLKEWQSCCGMLGVSARKQQVRRLPSKGGGARDWWHWSLLGDFFQLLGVHG